MSFLNRWRALRLALLLPLVVAGCATTSTPTPEPTDSTAALNAFNAAICPIFDEILEVDPRLADLRAVGAAGKAEALDPDELDAVVAVLGNQLDALEAVPDWPPGRNLRLQLIQALHGIRARLLLVSANPEVADALKDLAALPYIASDAMDLAFNRALEAGHTCETDD